MSNYIKHCTCRQCRAKRNYRQLLTRYWIRKNRRQTKIDLRRGDEPLNTIGVPYTD